MKDVIFTIAEKLTDETFLFNMVVIIGVIATFIITIEVIIKLIKLFWLIGNYIKERRIKK